ncbi:MAG: phytanoyl-CoA dioxygenase family protein [Burkholderiales bacterium]
MTIPIEFTTQGIADASVNAFTPYAGFLDSGEPYRSMLANNPWARPPKAHEPLEWGQGRYYDTTVARKHPYWKDTPLPRATRDLNRLRHDLHDWGYCLIEDGLSKEQCARLYNRVADQAAAERALGIAYLDPAQQHVWSLVNKGEMFVRCLEHDTEFVQAGAVVERLLDETLGSGWNHYSLLSNISYPDCYPQGLHQDQNFIAPHRMLEGPPLVNAIYVLQDVDEVNGGTLIIPGSHRTRTEGDFYGPLPPTINLEAAAGTILIMDGRTFHAGAVNRSKKLRYIVTNSIVKNWVRQQEAFLLSISPQVLERASDKFLWRVGYSANVRRNIVEGYGYRGNSEPGDPNGSTVHVRRAMDAGAYQHVGELSMAGIDQVDVDHFTLTRIQRDHETFRSPRYVQRLQKLDEH